MRAALGPEAPLLAPLTRSAFEVAVRADLDAAEAVDRVVAATGGDLRLETRYLAEGAVRVLLDDEAAVEEVRR